MSIEPSTPFRAPAKIGILGDPYGDAVRAYRTAAAFLGLEADLVSPDAAALGAGDLLVIADRRDDVDAVAQRMLERGIHVLSDHPITFVPDRMIDLYAKALSGGGDHPLLLWAGLAARLEVTGPMSPDAFARPRTVIGTRRLPDTGSRRSPDALVLDDDGIDALARGLAYLTPPTEDTFAMTATVGVGFGDDGDSISLTMRFRDGGALHWTTHRGGGAPCHELGIAAVGARAEFTDLGAPIGAQLRRTTPEGPEDFRVNNLAACRVTLFIQAVQAIVAGTTEMRREDLLLLHTVVALREVLAAQSVSDAVRTITF